MDGWWCVRYGDALAWVETPSEAAAGQRSLDLHPLGDWTDDTRKLVVFPQDSYPENAGPHDYTRVVPNAGPPSRRRTSSRDRPRARPTHGSSRAARCVGCAPVTGASGSSLSLAYIRALRSSERV